MIAPELQLVIINAVCLGLAYGAILPGLVGRGMGALAAADAMVAVVAIGTAGALFWGSGQGFSVIVFELNWFGFALFSFLAMELPLFRWFCRRHGIGGGD